MPNRQTISSVLILTIASVMFTGCKPSGPAPGMGGPQGPVPVQTVRAASQDVPITGEWVATTDGYVNAQIQPQVSGYLIRQDYKEGSEVRKGQVLFEIDPRPLQAVLDQAKGSLAQTQAQAQLAAINVQRDKPLAEQHAIAQSQLDQEVQTQKADEASVASAQAQVAQAALNLSFTKVRSLIDGVAGQAAIQVGNLVSTSSTLTSVSQLNPIKVFFYISEQEYLALSQQAKSSGGDLLNAGNAVPLKLVLANTQAYPHTGRIIFVDRSVSAQTGSIRLAASFPNPGNLLRPGQFGKISAQTQVLHNAVVVPQRVVTELQGMNQVYVVGPDNVVHVHTVQLGKQIGQNVIIAGGLNARDTVVSEGLDKLKDGAKVQPQPDNTPANAPAAQQPQGN